MKKNCKPKTRLKKTKEFCSGVFFVMKNNYRPSIFIFLKFGIHKKVKSDSLKLFSTKKKKKPEVPKKNKQNKNKNN